MFPTHLFSRPRRSLAPVFGLCLAAVPALGIAAPPVPPSAAPRPAASSSAAPAASSGPSNPLLAARALFLVGVEHLEKKEWADAHAALAAAYSFKQHWQIAMVLGQAEIEVGKLRSAVQHLTMAAADPEAKEKAADQIASLLQEAKARLPRVQIESAPAGVRLSIDGEPAGTAPLSGPIDIDPGKHTLTAEMGNWKVSQPMTIPAREKGSPETPVKVNLIWPKDPERPFGEATGAPDGDSSAGDGARGNVPVLVLGAAAGASLLAGLGVFIASEVKGGEAIAARDAYNLLPPERRADEQEKLKVHNLLVEQDALITGAVVAWIGAAVLGGGAAGYYLLQTRSSKPKESSASRATRGPTVRWAPTASPSGAGLVIQGSF